MHQDYILRMIEQFFSALAAIMQSRRAGRQEEAYYLIQAAGQDYLQFNILTLLNCDLEQCLAQLKVGDVLDVERVAICGDLLHELALIFESNGLESDATRLKTLSLQLYQTVIATPSALSEARYRQKIQLLTQELE